MLLSILRSTIYLFRSVVDNANIDGSKTHAIISQNVEVDPFDTAFTGWIVGFSFSW
jgi:hypothetical protein